MRTDRELLELALAVMPRVGGASQKMVIDEIYARLAEPEDEPFCYVWPPIKLILDGPNFPPGVTSDIPIIPLYRHPPRQPVRLSDEEIQECFDAGQKSFLRHQSGIKGQQLNIRDWPYWHFAKAIEQAIMEKNK